MAEMGMGEGQVFCASPAAPTACCPGAAGLPAAPPPAAPTGGGRRGRGAGPGMAVNLFIPRRRYPWTLPDRSAAPPLPGTRPLRRRPAGRPLASYSVSLPSGFCTLAGQGPREWSLPSRPTTACADGGTERGLDMVPEPPRTGKPGGLPASQLPRAAPSHADRECSLALGFCVRDNVGGRTRGGDILIHSQDETERRDWPGNTSGGAVLLELAVPGVQGMLGTADERGEVAGGQAAAPPGVQRQQALLGDQGRGRRRGLHEQTRAAGGCRRRGSSRAWPRTALTPDTKGGHPCP
jgi:hypothetical protein